MNPLVMEGAAQLLLGKYKSQKGLFMKNMLTMAATGLVIFASLGWYLDWYKVARTTTPDGKQHITIDVNTKRIETDYEKGREKLSGYINTAPAQPTPYPNQPYPNQPYPNQPYPNPSAPPAWNPSGYPPNAGAPPAYQPPANWTPAAPTSRPAGNYPAYPPMNQPSIPGRPF